ncbi:MAG: hypothetical protein N3A66_06135, partial [Planctomycetota bacterium]|nr:hypothetical protein [Planctomycetota bacterium]
MKGAIRARLRRHNGQGVGCFGSARCQKERGLAIGFKGEVRFPACPGHAAAFHAAAHAGPARAQALQLSDHAAQALFFLFAKGMPGQEAIKTVRGERRVPGKAGGKADLLLDIARAPMQGEEALAAFGQGIRRQRAERLHIRLPGGAFVDIAFDPGHGPALALRRQLAPGCAHLPAQRGVDVVMAGEDHALGKKAIITQAIIREPHPAVAAPAHEHKPHPGRFARQAIGGQARPFAKADGLPDAVVAAQIREKRPLFCHERRRLAARWRRRVAGVAAALVLPEGKIGEMRIALHE